MTPIVMHRLLGFLVLVFIVAHLGNHMALFFGVDRHLDVQKMLRPVYQHPVVEPILLTGIAIQLFFGLRLVLKRGRPRNLWSRMQTYSGIILILFLTQHIGAALYTRTFWPSIDTNIYWAASVVSRTPFSIYFGPYYVLGIAAIFIHIAAFLALKKRRRLISWSICVFGVVFSVTLVAALGGAFFPIDLPPAYGSYLMNLSP
jgi:hypothetical protein